MIVSEVDQILLDRLWKFAKSEHFTEVYEEIIRKEAFVKNIKDGIQPSDSSSPFREFSTNDINRMSDIQREVSDRLALVVQLKELVHILEDDADPYSGENQAGIHTRIQQVKNAINWM